jgi:hypothetical protein
VTRLTVRQAVEFLKREGLVSSRQGRGTIVAAQPKTILWRDLPRSWAELVDSADSLESDMLELAGRPGYRNRRTEEMAILHRITTLFGAYSGARGCPTLSAHRISTSVSSMQSG